MFFGSAGGGGATAWGLGAAQAASRSVAASQAAAIGRTARIGYSAILTAKRVPRTPMVATGVTKVADSGARRAMSPET